MEALTGPTSECNTYVALIELDDHTVKRVRRAHPQTSTSQAPEPAPERRPLPPPPPDPEMEQIAANWQPGTLLSACIMSARVERWQRRQAAKAKATPKPATRPPRQPQRLTPASVTGPVSRILAAEAQKAQVAS